MELPDGYTFEKLENGFTLKARLRCAMAEARCLAVVCASWALAAAGEGAELFWPNRVERDGARLCAVECRALASGEVAFTFRPDAALPVPPEAFAAAVLHEAIPALEGYPENRAALMDRYCERCRTVMKFVNVTYRGVPLYGFAFAVDRHGGLMVMTQVSRTVVTLYGGEAEIVKKGDAPDEPAELPAMPGR